MSVEKLKTSFGFWAAVSMVVGSIIGSGIFMKPATMAGQLGSPELLILVWIGAGIITLFGALGNAELAAMIPETGGQYVYFRKMYGEFFAFLYGWAGIAVINTAGVASIAYVCGTYAEYFFDLPRLIPDAERSVDLFIPFIGHIYPLENIGVKAVTIAVVVVFTMISFLSSKAGGKFLVFITFLKVAAIMLLVMGLLFSGAGETENFFRNDSSINLKGWALLAAIMAAMSGAFWGYDGWNNITFIGGEIKDPQKNIPRSLAMGIFACIVIYVLVTIAYLYVLPVDVMGKSSMVATDATMIVFGTIGAGLIALLVIISTTGATHSNILSTARITFSMAREGKFFRSLGKVHPVFKTPGNALIIHGAWSCLLVLSGSFDMLTDMLIFLSYLFYGMSALGIFVLRKKMPDAVRPYKVWGYPFVPAIFVLFSAFFLSVTLFNDIANYIQGKTFFINSVFGLVLMITGVPVYWYFRKQGMGHRA